MLGLYYTPGACSMAAHIVLEESGETYEPLRVDLAKGEQRMETYLKINPQGRVPVLRLDMASLWQRIPRSRPISASVSGCGRRIRSPKPRRSR
jgi:glutathione S-transferase